MAKTFQLLIKPTEELNLIAGDNITITGEYPNLTISAVNDGESGVQGITGQGSVLLDSTDPSNPIVGLTPGAEDSIAKAQTALQSETLTALGDLALTGNVLTVKYTGENGVEQTKAVDLSSLVVTDVKITNATYDASTNIITLTNSDGSEFNINLSEFSIIPTTDVNGVTILTQEGVVKATISKAGQTGDFDDLFNKPDLQKVLAEGNTSNGYNIDITNSNNGVFRSTSLDDGSFGEYSAWFAKLSTPSTGNSIEISSRDINFYNSTGSLRLNTNPTSNRVQTFPDKDGTVALLSDISAATGSFVTTDTAQTITGTKSITQYLAFKDYTGAVIAYDIGLLGYNGGFTIARLDTLTALVNFTADGTMNLPGDAAISGDINAGGDSNITGNQSVNGNIIQGTGGKTGLGITPLAKLHIAEATSDALRIQAPLTNVNTGKVLTWDSGTGNVSYSDTTTIQEFVAVNNGWGLRSRIGAEAAYGAPVGLRAIDLSFSGTPISTLPVGQESFAIGVNSKASGNRSFAGGVSCIAQQAISFVFGFRVNSYSVFETVFGQYNTSYTPANAAAWNTADRLFVLGNGINAVGASDAFIAYKSGLLTAPTMTTAMITAEVTGKALVTKEYLKKTSVTKYYAEATLVAGLNTITHNLALTYPNSAMVQLVNLTDGSVVPSTDFGTTNRTANSLDIVLSGSLNVAITIIG